MMRFSSFMQEWLYGYDGYYSTFREIGKEGDFYTAVSTSSFFGGSIAKRAIDTINSGFLSKDTTILEIGAHKGYLLADIIQFIYTLEPKLLDKLHFAIYEPQEQILKTQQQYLKESFGDAIDIKFFKSWDEIELDSAFVVANEIFDAFSCELVKDDKMLYVDNGKLFFDDIDDKIRAVCEKYNIKKGEIPLGYGKFSTHLKDSIDRFEFVTFDYGEMEHRGEYSIRVYYKHKVYPFFSLSEFVNEKERVKDIKLSELYKKSDITYDLFFRYLIDEFKSAGVNLLGFYNQSKALVDFGLIELLEILKKNVPQKSYLSELNRVKVLIDPAFMGERFKCIVFRG